MRKGDSAALVLAVMGVLVSSHAQTQKPIPGRDQAIDWKDAGAGAIPSRKTLCASLTPLATLAEINAALASCPSGETVKLGAGTYSIPGTVVVPSNVTLRGEGASRTILNAVGTGGGDVIGMGSGRFHFILSGLRTERQAGPRRLRSATDRTLRLGCTW